jgi:undecaprenyl-diphosphatase
MLMVAVVLGIVEGLTEFIPVSSTGHLILASSLLGFEGKRAETFEVFIQLGAILSVVWEYRVRLWRMTAGFFQGGKSRPFGLKLLLAFLPAAFVGLLVHDYISEYLFSPLTVAAALIVGAILILVIESMHLEVRTRNVESVTWTQAFLIGVAQCLSLWPDFSRSAATILGGLTVGLDRRRQELVPPRKRRPRMAGPDLCPLVLHRLGLHPLATPLRLQPLLPSLRLVSNHRRPCRPIRSRPLACSGGTHVEVKHRKVRLHHYLHAVPVYSLSCWRLLP